MREEEEELEKQLKELESGGDSAARRGVTLFEHSGYEGRSETLYEDDPRLSDNRIGNDRASSIRVPEGCSVTLYRDSEYRGRTAKLTTDSPDLGRTSVDSDAVSSLKIHCE